MGESNLFLDQGSIGRYVIGGHVSARTRDGRHIEHRDQGYVIYVSDNRIDGIFVHFRTGKSRHGYGAFKGYRGKIFWGGHGVEMNEGSTFEDVKSIFGEPTNTWNDGVELNAKFIESEFEYEFSWDVENKSALDYISISRTT